MKATRIERVEDPLRTSGPPESPPAILVPPTKDTRAGVHPAESQKVADKEVTRLPQFSNVVDPLVQ